MPEQQRVSSPHGNVLERSQKFSHILCPYCYRNFCEKAGARHIEHCREKAKLRFFKKGHVVKNQRFEGSAEQNKSRKGRSGMYSSVQETTSDKGKGSTVEGNGLSASRNSNKGQSRGLKNPTKSTTMKKSATQSKLMTND